MNTTTTVVHFDPIPLPSRCPRWLVDRECLGALCWCHAMRALGETRTGHVGDGHPAFLTELDAAGAAGFAPGDVMAAAVRDGLGIALRIHPRPEQHPAAALLLVVTHPDATP